MMKSVTEEKDAIEKERNQMRSLLKANEDALKEVTQDLHIAKDTIEQ